MTLSHLIPEMGKIRLCGGAEERTADGATGQQNIGLTFSSRRIVGPIVLKTTNVRKRWMGFYECI